MSKRKGQRPQISKPVRLRHIGRRAPDMHGGATTLGKGRMETTESRQAVKRLLTDDDPDSIFLGEHSAAPRKRIETLAALDDVGAQLPGVRRFRSAEHTSELPSRQVIS